MAPHIFWGISNNFFPSYRTLIAQAARVRAATQEEVANARNAVDQLRKELDGARHSRVRDY